VNKDVILIKQLLVMIVILQHINVIDLSHITPHAKFVNLMKKTVTKKKLHVTIVRLFRQQTPTSVPTHPHLSV